MVKKWVRRWQIRNVPEVLSSEADDDLEVDDNFCYEFLEDPDEVNDVLELDDVLELHFMLVKLTSN